MKTENLSQLNEALEVIVNFQKSPLKYIAELNKAKNIVSQTVIKDRGYIDNILAEMGDVANIDRLCANLDRQNQAIVAAIPMKIKNDRADYTLNLMPVDRVGIYIPNKLPSSAMTYLSMAIAAGVRDIVVYLAQDEKGNPDPLSVYVCDKYGAETWGGPARVGFPALAYGLDDKHPKVDLICGPCGNKLNLIKCLSALINECGIDMNAGASDLCIVVNDEWDWQQIYLDLLSQLEHGSDSLAQLILVGHDCQLSFKECLFRDTLAATEKVSVLYCNTLEEAAKIVDETAPESLELLMNDFERFIPMISNYGVLYINTSSTLGDYAVIGRGCADPTNGLSRAQSGISPYTFLKIRPIVHPVNIDRERLLSAQYISGYEGLNCHTNVINHHLNKK